MTRRPAGSPEDTGSKLPSWFQHTTSGSHFQSKDEPEGGPREGARKPRWAEPPWGQASGSAGLGGRLPRLGRRPHGRGPGRPEVQRPRSQTLARSAAYAAFGQAVSRTRSAARAGRPRAACQPEPAPLRGHGARPCVQALPVAALAAPRRVRAPSAPPSGPTPLAAKWTITYSFE